MAVPKQRTSKARRDKRRSHDHLTEPQHIEKCSNCEEPKLRHHVCGSCGHFKGRHVLPNLGA